MTSISARPAGLPSIHEGLIGERGFDFATIFTNPDLADAAPPAVAGLARRRLPRWILAWTGLSEA
nr:aminoglycoside phosphotransferase family protein [Roseicella sp. DB1501]